MRILHCADLHLDSNMKSVIGSELAKSRKAELLHAFEAMVDYAAKNDVDAILIAGDMFDSDRISATACKAVRAAVTNHPDIGFYYLRGNHDRAGFLSSDESLPANLYMFPDTWKSYSLGKEGSGIILTGAELSSENSAALPSSLVLDGNCFNIVMLHGQESESAARDRAEVIDLRAYRNKGIDYMALGHIHSYKYFELDKRGFCCYPGCLEGRGYDESGVHGFAVLDIDESTGRMEHTFVPFAGRQIHVPSIDVSECMDNIEIVNTVSDFLADSGISHNDYLRIVLTGAMNVERDEISAEYIRSNFEYDYYHVSVKDHTTLRVNYEDYLLEESLKGEFVRLVNADLSLSDEEKAEVIRCGFSAIAGGQV